MTEERRNRLICGTMLLIGALGCASMRNNPELGISPLTVGIIEGLIYACIMMSVRLSDWRMAVVTALVTPVFLWSQRFLDGFMIPVDMAVNLTMIGFMCLAMRRKNYWLNVAMLALPAYAVMLAAGTVAIWVVKDENLIRSMIVAWNTDVYAGFSILGAALACAPFAKKGEAR